MEPVPQKDVKALVKKILTGAYDDQKEVDWLNTITYKHLPPHEKLDFRSKYLKHIPVHVLEEREMKKKMKMEEM